MNLGEQIQYSLSIFWLSCLLMKSLLLEKCQTGEEYLIAMEMILNSTNAESSGCQEKKKNKCG